jgi:hypothetical protein
MSRIIKPESAGKERTQLSRAIVLAIRELMHKTTVDDQTRDLAAFIAMALHAMFETIDSSVLAWEKRGYWVKADRFRMDWIWTDNLGTALRNALLTDDWAGVARISAQVLQRLQDVVVPQRNHIGTPWVGAWERFRQGQ